jgi:hypothetical protein
MTTDAAVTERPSIWRETAPSTNTAAVWWLVFLPIAFLLGAIGVVVAFLFSSASAFVIYIPSVLLFLLPVVAVCVGALQFVVILGVAFIDQAMLRRSGHPRTASPVWSLLGPLPYVIVRTAKLGKGSGAPLFASAASTGVYIIVVSTFLAFYAGWFLP